MSEITVYAFETEGDQPASDFTTMSVTEAREYAKANGYSLIARTFEYTDSELIEDYRPGHNVDGTPVEDGVADDLAALEDAALAERRGLR